MRYTKYGTRVKLVLAGDDDLFVQNAGSVYRTIGSYINGKTIRFNLGSSFNDLQLSQNARCIMEACYMPAIPGINNYMNISIHYQNHMNISIHLPKSQREAIKQMMILGMLNDRYE
jgi:hypothetical protein